MIVNEEARRRAERVVIMNRLAQRVSSKEILEMALAEINLEDIVEPPSTVTVTLQLPVEYVKWMKGGGLPEGSEVCLANLIARQLP